LESEKAHSTGVFVIVAKFSEHVLHRFASSLSNVGRQADENSSLGDSFRIQYLAFGRYLFVLNTIFGFGSAKAIP